MIQVKFKNLEKSELIREVVHARLYPIIEKFDDLTDRKLQVTLEMQNSPSKAGPDLFKVKVHICQGRYAGVTLEKANSNLYVALADLIDHMLEVLNRFGDRARVRERKEARKLSAVI